jgi:epoxyqueuosine reductase
MVDRKQEKAAQAAFSFIRACLAEPGFPKPSAWRFLDAPSLRQVCGKLTPESRARLGIDRAGAALVAALAYSDGPSSLLPWVDEAVQAYPGPSAGLARFARADWYGELLACLKALSDRVRSDLAKAGFEPGGKADWQRFANSGLPEGQLAVASGLGAQGRHGLVIVGPSGGPSGELSGGHGSGGPVSAAGRPAAGRIVGPGVILGILLLPFALPEEEKEALGLPAGPEAFAARCGSCRACIEACPTGALGFGATEALFSRESCLQHWTALSGPLPPKVEARWGGRLYGCDACLEACPHFRPDPAADCGRGALGPGLPAAWMLSAPEDELKARLKGTALGLGWMSLDAFRRNARLALFDGQGPKA